MDNDFISMVEETIAIINGSFHTSFLPRSRSLIESDDLQRKLFDAVDRLKYFDCKDENVLVELKPYLKFDDPTRWYIFRSYHPSELEPGKELMMSRCYELTIEAPCRDKHYLVRCHWTINLTDDVINTALLLHQWILKLNDRLDKIEGNLNYFTGDFMDTVASYELAPIEA